LARPPERPDASSIDSALAAHIFRSLRSRRRPREVLGAQAETIGAAHGLASADIMFAVIRTGGKQYKVAQDDLVIVEKLSGEPGAVVDFDEVLMIGDGAELSAGTPLVAGATVSATIVEQSRAAKILVFKKKRRHNYRRKKGHRQYQTVLRIGEIRAADAAMAEPAEAAAATEAPAVTEEGATDGA
jgi:large subunit ribosomal protein L21